MGWLIAYLGVADIVVEFFASITDDPVGIVLLFVVFLLVTGTVLNPISAVLIFLPIIRGLGNTAGMDPVHMGVPATIVLSVGLITPPYGICLLIAAQIGDVPPGRAMLAVASIVLLTIGTAVLSIVFPALVLGLPAVAFPDLFRQTEESKFNESPTT